MENPGKFFLGALRAPNFAYFTSFLVKNLKKIFGALRAPEYVLCNVNFFSGALRAPQYVLCNVNLPTGSGPYGGGGQAHTPQPSPAQLQGPGNDLDALNGAFKIGPKAGH